eukprot:PhF_6_TR40975/c0_g1_i2/m.62033
MAKHLTGTTLGNNPALYPYVMEHINDDPIQQSLRAEIEQATHSRMAGAPDESAFFNWFLPTLNAKYCVEVGVFRGSTTLSLARAIQADGKVFALDISEEYMATGRPYWAQAGVVHKVEPRIGPGTESMEKLLAEGYEGKIDFVFIDADKVNYPQYYELALRLLRVGGIVAVDNVLWGGSVISVPESMDADTKAITG